MKSFLIFSSFLFICLSANGQLDLEANFSYDQLEDLLASARAENDHQILADAYYLLAKFEKEKLSNDELAYEYFSRSRDYYKIIDDKDQLFEVERLIIGKSLESGLHTEAILSLQKMLKTFDKKSDAEKMVRLYMDLAKANNGKGDIERELYYQNLAVQLNKSVGNKYLTIELFISKMNSYININELDSAMIISKEVLVLADSLNESEFICQALFKQGSIFQRLSQYQKSLEAYNKAKKYCGQKPYDSDRLNLYGGLAKVHQALNEYEQAYIYSSQYAALNDSILNQERSKSLSNLSYKFSVQEKNKELRLLELENNYALERNSQQRRALWVLGIGLGALAILLYYIIRVYNQRILANRLINTQKEEINNQRISKLEDDLKINSMQSMLEGQEIERERIAKDLHDSLGGVLSTVKLQFDSVQSHVKEVADLEAYRKAHSLIDSAVDEVRSISQNLQPSALENLGLIPAIKDLINRFDSENNPEIDFQFYSFPEGLGKMTSLYIYRMVQELLYNSIKHANAKEIMIQLTKDEHELVIHYEDDGIGFNPEKNKSAGMGMNNLKARADYLKGSITIDSKEGEGASFLIHIPYKLDV